ncbi:hypothetical protein NEIG_01816 [Nematocida sp. ERTm5]|nr:hypothetical protein NEIRO02_1455 [Nematocida sp. AWRm79]KAI5184021.1 hypothetical protein NEIRO03_1488 [Nematocida sp. AWRm78]OAG33331.1 hypothetical protein NEIG_01816 [Nematocida sp. ERTm5]
MSRIRCMECGSIYKTTQTYEKHISATKHKRIEELTWYASRIGKNEGLFVQTIIEEFGWEPFYLVEENEVESILHIYKGDSENISLLIDKREIDMEKTFDYFDATLSIYTVSLVFRSNCN